ncbi:hypothetical protein D9613_012166 [Agrocybe pediades]|uniref:Uncharacterized protein n=1 Tax=Agrocybe pediades TaxID=84607 RepID=A0A8H4R2T5_9AGAR|nr:hypothetical protein D9613_012166 [Agrocybe pediades]
MGRKGRRSEQAKAQRKSGKRGFDSGILENPFEKLLDPDFEPDPLEDDLEDDPVTGDEMDTNYAFSLYERNEGEEQLEGVGQSGREPDESKISDEEEEYSDFEGGKAYQASERVQQVTASKKPRLLSALPTYSGSGTAMVYRRKQLLKKAAAGSNKITSYFNAKEGSGPIPEPGKDNNGGKTSEDDRAHIGSVAMSGQTQSYNDFWKAAASGPVGDRYQRASSASETERDTDHLARPDSSCKQSTESAAANTQAHRNVMSISTLIHGPDVESENHAPAEAEPVPPNVEEETRTSHKDAAEFLDVREDDGSQEDDEPPTAADIVSRLIKGAKAHKSFASLFKLHAVKSFLELCELYRRVPAIKNPRVRASTAVARSVGRGPYFAKQMRKLSLYIHRFRTLPPTGSGKHHGHPSLLNDERIAQAVRRYLTVTALGEITTLELQKTVNTIIIPAIGLDLGGKSISERCARRWLHKLGYSMTEVKKGVYIDGHERQDVVDYRKDFLKEVKELERLRYTFNQETLEPVAPKLGPGEKLHIPIHQDESIFRTNELRRRVWAKDDKTPLRKKGQGKSQHVSAFATELTGTLKLSKEVAEAQKNLPEKDRIPEDSREIMYPGKNSDGWWNAERLIKQVTTRAIPIFEKMYPGAVAEFFFDQSTAHGAFAPDALNANEMNVNPAGKQRKMKDTTIPDNNPNNSLRGKIQTMVFSPNLPPDHPFYEFRGLPKGMKYILKERGLWDYLTHANGGKEIPGDCQYCKASRKEKEKRERELEAIMAGQDEPEEADEDDVVVVTGATCCMRKVLSEQDDFRLQKPLLQVVIEEAGHKCYFLPKFHCELNPIEMYWGWTKIKYRCLADGTWKTAKELLPELLDACPVKTIRAFYRKTWRYMDAYEKGLSARQAEYAVKKYRQHRKVGARIMMDAERVENAISHASNFEPRNTVDVII